MCAMLCGTEPMHLGILWASPASQIHRAMARVVIFGARAIGTGELALVVAKVSRVCDASLTQST